jgi:hypothetical protein
MAAQVVASRAVVSSTELYIYIYIYIYIYSILLHIAYYKMPLVQPFYVQLVFL